MKNRPKPEHSLRQLATPLKAKGALRFFKSGPGEYGDGDLFLGVSVPEVKGLAKIYIDLKLPEVLRLLKSPYHEVRLLGLTILVSNYEKSKSYIERKKIVNFYVKHRKAANNWDLVDLSTYKILGHYCHTQGSNKVILNLAKSKHHWDRRMAIVATLAYIRQGETKLTFKLAQTLLNDPEDLMHKATGWMLREAGKRDQKALLKFIDKFGKQMPRTMLRYSIEKFPQATRLRILKKTKF